MKTKLGTLALLSALAGLSSVAVANSNDGINKVELEQIHAACKEEARGAENPQWYAEECVDERVQALKVERGLAQPPAEEKEES